MILRYRRTLQDYADRQRKLTDTDEAITQECIVMLAKGAAVVAVAMLVLWVAL